MKSMCLHALLLTMLLVVQPLAEAGVIAEHPGRWVGGMQIPDGPLVKLGAELYTRADGSH